MTDTWWVGRSRSLTVRRLGAVVAVLSVLLLLGLVAVVKLWPGDDESQAANAARAHSGRPPASTRPFDEDDVTTWPELTALPPSTESTADTPEGDASRIAFVNGTGRPVVISWLDYDGLRHEYATIDPGGTYTQETYAGHLWVAAGTDGAAIAIFRSGPGPGRAVVR